AVLAAPAGTLVGSAALRHGSAVAWLKEGSVALHPAPGSPQVSATVAGRTEFGSRTSLPVVAARGEWLEVISTQLRNGVHGFVRRWQLRLTRSPLTIDVDLSGRLLRVWRRGTAVLRVAVGIGAARSPTPIGRFGVTDKLTGFNPAAYGCCILALSAHQTHLPSGWAGGDRIAIHGGGGIGAATSNGCLHATEAVLHWLMRRVGLGTQVVIHP
ncbi:MAG TPA: L,D-transpeptidase, partial [Gaiellaceae bacterium]|nr:L,D-transpeptidase [Gaiellaceae bacterium]